MVNTSYLKYSAKPNLYILRENKSETEDVKYNPTDDIYYLEL